MRFVVGHGRGHHRSADAPAPARAATGEVEAVEPVPGRADEQLVVERRQPRRHAAELPGPHGLPGGQDQRHRAAVRQPQIQVVQGRNRRHVRHGAERRAPQQFAVSGAEGRQVAALEGQDQPARVPVGRSGHGAGQRALPGHGPGVGAPGLDATGDDREHEVAAHGHRQRRGHRHLPAGAAAVEIPGDQLRRHGWRHTPTACRRRAAPPAAWPPGSSSAGRGRRR